MGLRVGKRNMVGVFFTRPEKRLTGFFLCFVPLLLKVPFVFLYFFFFGSLP